MINIFYFLRAQIYKTEPRKNGLFTYRRTMQGNGAFALGEGVFKFFILWPE